VRLSYDIEYLDNKKIIIKTTIKKVSTRRAAYRYVVQLPKFWIKKFKDNSKVKVTVEVLK